MASASRKALRCKTPELVRKELWTHILANNLIRHRLRGACRWPCRPIRQQETAVDKQPGDLVKTPSDLAAQNKSEKEKPYQAHVRSLTDHLLLFVRDGRWHKVSDLAAWLAPRLKPEFAIQRFLKAGGTHDQKLEHKAGKGQQLVLQDILESLQHQRLLAARRGEAGEDEVRSTPLTDDRFAIDPEFESLLPRAPDEVKQLEERLLVEEPRDPLVVWQGQ